MNSIIIHDVSRYTDDHRRLVRQLNECRDFGQNIILSPTFPCYLYIRLIQLGSGTQYKDMTLIFQAAQLSNDSYFIDDVRKSIFLNKKTMETNYQ